MNINDPKLKLSCFYKDGTEKQLTFDIDLSYDPLLGKPYIKNWIEYLIKKNFSLNNIDYINICQTNIEFCKEDLPYWYYQFNVITKK